MTPRTEHGKRLLDSHAICAAWDSEAEGHEKAAAAIVAIEDEAEPVLASALRMVNMALRESLRDTADLFGTVSIRERVAADLDLTTREQASNAAAQLRIDVRELLQAGDALAEAANLHGKCNGPSCGPYPNYHSRGCDDDPDLRAALARWREVTR